MNQEQPKNYIIAGFFYICIVTLLVGYKSLSWLITFDHILGSIGQAGFIFASVLLISKPISGYFNKIPGLKSLVGTIGHFGISALLLFEVVNTPFLFDRNLYDFFHNDILIPIIFYIIFFIALIALIFLVPKINQMITSQSINPRVNVDKWESLGLMIIFLASIFPQGINRWVGWLTTLTQSYTLSTNIILPPVSLFITLYAVILFVLFFHSHNEIDEPETPPTTQPSTPMQKPGQTMPTSPRQAPQSAQQRQPIPPNPLQRES